MNMYGASRDLNSYLDRRFQCSCGKEHYAPLKAVRIGEGALGELPVYVKKYGFRSVCLVADGITYRIAGRACMELLEGAGIKAVMHTLAHLGFDEAAVGELLIHMPMDCDLLIAVGTGAINDLTRFFSYRIGRPFFTVATAAPMDGFASGIAAIYTDNLKTTYHAAPPMVILGDTDILKEAPYSMIAAGLGDLLGKFTCLCDWKLAHLITGEHYCPSIAELVEGCTKNVLEHADQARERDAKVIGAIMEGLVLSGVAMSLYGNSRSASGCEQHMSHYWEMMFEQRGQRPAPHGVQVGVGAVLVLKLVEVLLRTRVDFRRARECAGIYDKKVWEQRIRKAYGPAAEGVIALEEKAHKNDTPGRLERIAVMEEKWPEIQRLLEELPDSEQVISILKSLGAPCYPDEIGIDRKLLENTFLYCKEVRDRYTILQMVWDLGILEQLALQVMEQVTEKRENVKIF